MKRAIAVAIALACAACGDSADVPIDPSAPRPSAAPQRGAANEAPTIEDARIVPNPAGAADALTFELTVRDPERDRLTTTIEWYKNGELVPELQGTVVDAGTFNRGDRVYAIAYVSDATHEVNAQSPALAIGNSPPRVRSVFISPSRVTAADIVEAQANAEDRDGDSFEVAYRWYRNGVPIAAATSARLAPGTAHRGDKLMVEASATDGSDAGPWLQSPPVLVANASPAITSQPSYDMADGGHYTYSPAAKDVDGDTPLRFELVDGPKGMAVDESSGVVTWAVPRDANGNHAITIAVTDSYGGRATQAWLLAVDWNQPPAGDNETQNAKPKPKAQPSAEAQETAAEDETGADDESPAQTPAKRPLAKPAKKTPPKAAPANEDEPEQDEGAPYEEE